jgi:hypothetical protein
MAQRLLFDVFGATMEMKRHDHRWLLLRISGDGKSSPVNEVVIPDNLAEEELAGFLDDMFHEYATLDHPAVSRLE